MYVYDIIGWYLIYIYLNHTETYMFPSFIYIPVPFVGFQLSKKKNNILQAMTNGDRRKLRGF